MSELDVDALLGPAPGDEPRPRVDSVLVEVGAGRAYGSWSPAPERTLSVSSTDREKIAALVGAYQVAIAAQGGRWVPEAWMVQPTRGYGPKLIRCADAMLEHDVDPVGWCRWRLASGKRLGPLRVLDAAYVRRTAGWYRKERDAARAATVPSDTGAVARQHAIAEARARALGYSGPAAYLGLPLAYKEESEAASARGKGGSDG